MALLTGQRKLATASEIPSLDTYKMRLSAIRDAIVGVNPIGVSIFADSILTVGDMKLRMKPMLAAVAVGTLLGGCQHDEKIEVKTTPPSGMKYTNVVTRPTAICEDKANIERAEDYLKDGIAHLISSEKAFISILALNCYPVFKGDGLVRLHGRSGSYARYIYTTADKDGVDGVRQEGWLDFYAEVSVEN